MIRLEPRTPFLEARAAFAESATVVQTPVEFATAPKPVDPVPVSGFNPDRLRLDDFPEYEFDPDGTPHRFTSLATRGPAPRLGRVEPDRANRFALRNREGQRVLLTRSRLVSLLAGTARHTVGRFFLDQFPRECFDMTGMAYGIRDGRPRKFQPFGNGEFPARRFRLFNSETGSKDWVTDIAIRRMRDGHTTFRSCALPEGCAYLPPEFPDYCVDLFSGQPYRLGSIRFTVTNPIPVSPHRDGNFCLRDFSGKRRWLTSRDLLAMVNPEPRTGDPENQTPKTDSGFGIGMPFPEPAGGLESL